MDQARVEAIDAPALHRLFKELGFNRHTRDLDDLLTKHPALKGDAEAAAGEGFATSLFDGGKEETTAGDATTAESCDYQTICTQSELDELLETLKTQSIISVDVETIGLGHKTALCGFCFAWQPGGGVYVPVRSPEPEQHLPYDTVVEALGPILEDPALPKCGHNLKYDFLVLKHAGITLRGITFDTMVAGYLTGAPGRALDDMALAELNHEMMPITDLIGRRGRGMKQKTMDQVPLSQITPYAAEDADISLRLYERLKPRLDTMGLTELSKSIEMPLVEVLAMMEYFGIRVDANILDQQRQSHQTRIDEHQTQIH
jgi:DNA polymerase-1